MSEQLNGGEVAAENTNLTSEPHVGEKLRLAREALGMSATDMAHALKLGQRQLEALEAGNWQGLPGNTFVRGFVRNYARLVNMDPAPLMAELDGSLEKPASNLTVSENAPATMPQAGGASRRDRAVVVTGIALVFVAASAYFMIPNDLSALRESTQGLLDSLARKEAPAPAPVAAPTAIAPAEPIFPPGTTPQQIMNPQATSAEAAPAEVAQASAPSASLPAAATETKPAAMANAPQLRFVFDKESWLEVRDRDNKPIFSQRVSAGTEQTLSGPGPLSLVIGYAPGVRVFSHGQAVDLAPHTRGEVARLVLE